MDDLTVCRPAFKYRCEASCRSARCPAALERIAAGWRNGRDISSGVRCLAGPIQGCTWPACRCEQKQQARAVAELQRRKEKANG